MKVELKIYISFLVEALFVLFFVAMAYIENDIRLTALSGFFAIGFIVRMIVVKDTARAVLRAVANNQDIPAE